jgi:hypothetical protein
LQLLVYFLNRQQFILAGDRVTLYDLWNIW